MSKLGLGKNCSLEINDHFIVRYLNIFFSDVPAEPVNLSVVPQNGGICFSWNAPKNDGGEQIAGYIVEYKDAESDWTEGANPVDCEHVFDDLPKGGTFKFRVAAYNKIGQGAFAEFGSEVGTAGGKYNLFINSVIMTLDSITKIICTDGTESSSVMTKYIFFLYFEPIIIR